MLAKDIFTNAQVEYLNRTYSPQTIEEYLPTWIAEGDIYIGNWIEVNLEEQSSKNSLIKLFVLYKSHQVPQFLQYSEDIRITLNENLKQVQKRQNKDKNRQVGKVISNTSSERFSEDFFRKKGLNGNKF